jgi:hypothetical protein
VKLNIYVYIIIVILVAGAITAATRVTTERIESEVPVMTGNTEPLVIIEVTAVSGTTTPKISLIAEEERCNKWGGEFIAESLETSADKVRSDTNQHGFTFSVRAIHDLRLSCVKRYTEANKEITETLFAHEMWFN